MELTTSERADILSQLDEYLWSQWDIPFTPAMPLGSATKILDQSQSGREIIDFIDNNESTIVFINSCRGSSKSANSLWRAIRNSNGIDGYRSLFLAATMGQMEEVFDIHWECLLQTCPRSRRPKKLGNRPRFKFPNNSMIAYSGMDQTKGRTKRGGQWDDIYCDELAFWLECWSPIMGGLYSQVERRKKANSSGRKCKIICQTTPPETPDHESKKLFDYCIRRDAAITKTIFDYPEFYTQERIEKIAADLGGMDSTQFKREMLCQFVTDTERAVVPQFSRSNNVIKEWKRPEFFDTYIGLDLGAKDFTHSLFGFVDYHKSVLIIESEIVLNYANATVDVIAQSIKERSASLWGKDKEVYRKIADNDLLELSNLSRMYGLHFIPANEAKINKDATLNKMRTMIKIGKIKIIESGCPVLIHQLENGIWNRSRTSYERSQSGGHLDGIDALAYMNFYVQWNHDPFPANYKLDPYNDLMVHQAAQALKGNAIREIMRPKFTVPIKR